MSAIPISSPAGESHVSGAIGQPVVAARENCAVLVDQDTIEQVCALTQELFGFPASVEVEIDPDHPRDRWLLFVVSSTAEIAAILRLERIWHERTARILPENPHLLRLCVNPLE